MDSERALKLLGPYSKWQLRTYFIYAFGFEVPLAWMWMSVVFIGDDPGHRCALSTNNTVNESIPHTCDDHGHCQYEQCVMYSDPLYRNETKPCDNGYWYDPDSGYESTLVTEFDLVCSKGTLVELSMTMNSVGQVLGAFIFPTLSDNYGRKRIFLACLWSNILIGIMQAFSVNMLMYTALALVDGLQLQGMVIAAAVLAIELFPTDQRTFAGVAFEFFWVLGCITMVPFVYFIRNWRYLQLAITLPLTFTIVFYWFIEESIPWLVANNKKKKAEAILRKAAKVNGITLPDDIFGIGESITFETTVDTSTADKYINVHRTEAGKDQSASDILPIGYKPTEDDHCEDYDEVEQTKKMLKFTTEGKTYQNEESKKGFKGMLNELEIKAAKQSASTENSEIPNYKFYDICRNKTMFLYAAIQCYLWFVISLGYNAMSLTVTYLPGNRYVNFFLYAVVEVPAYILIWLMIYYIGRRISVAICYLCGGLALLISIIPTLGNAEDLQIITIILSLIGKSVFTMGFAAVYVYTPEMYPTNIRTTGLGICQLSSKSANAIAPYFRVLARVSPWLPQAVIGSLSLFAGFVALVLPETRHEPLPHTIEQVLNFKRKLKSENV